MADPSGSNSKKRHKPVEPPPRSPSDSRFHNWNPRLSPTQREAGFGGAQKQYFHERPNESGQNGNNSMNQQRRGKASVFERLGGNVPQPQKRRNCNNWMETGTCPHGNNCHFLHPPLPLEGLPISTFVVNQQHHVPQLGYSQQPRPNYSNYQSNHYAASAGNSEDCSDYENAKLRSKVVVSKCKPSHSEDDNNGTPTNAKRPPHIPRDDEFGDDGQEMESEEALNQKIKEIKRQLEALDRGEEEAGHVSKNASDKRASVAESNSRQSVSKNGVASSKHSNRYKSVDQQPSSALNKPTVNSSIRARGSRRDEDTTQFHLGNLSLKSHGSPSRYADSSPSKNMRKHVNGERLGRGSVKRSPSTETSGSKRSRHSIGEATRRDYPRPLFVNTAPSAISANEADFRPRQQQYGQRNPPAINYNARHGYEHGASRIGNADIRRPAVGMAKIHASRPLPQHQEYERRLPDRYFDSTDDRGNHSKARTSAYPRNTSTYPRNEHQPIYQNRLEQNSLLARRLQMRNDGRTLKPPGLGATTVREESGNRRYPAPARTSGTRVDVSRTNANEHHRRHPGDTNRKEGYSADYRKRPLSSADSTRRESNSTTTSKRGKYEITDESRRKRRHGESSSGRSSKAESGSERKEKPETDVLDLVQPPADEKNALEERELEPISDEEVEESSGESSSIAVAEGIEQGRETDAALGDSANVNSVLAAEWEAVMPESGGAKASSGRRRCFDAYSFLPTFATCVEYADEAILEDAIASTTVEGLEMALKSQTALKRVRLLSDVGSSCRRAMSARVDLKMRRQLCGLVAEADTASTATELNAASNGRTFRQALSSFEKWTTTDDDREELDQNADNVVDDFRTTL